MIVTCSKCQKRYIVDPRSLGSPGRRVRCANCRHTWFEAAPEDAPSSIELPPPPETPPPVVRIAPDESDAVHRIQLPAVTRRGRGTRWLGRVALIVAVAIAMGALFAERQQVMSAVPFTTRFYAMVGLGPAVPGEGLQLRDVTPSRGVDNGVPTLAINGQVANVSRGPQPIPKLRIALRDANNNELQSWVVSVSDEPLAPGESVPFHTAISQPPEGATGVIVGFLPGGS
jgi:predicted Zn finger-like uncharacterized protein